MEARELAAINGVEETNTESLAELAARAPGESSADSHIDSAALRAEAYRKRRGTVATCKMPCEKQLPSISAKGLELEAFHQNHVGKGGFDPCSIFRNTWR